MSGAAKIIALTSLGFVTVGGTAYAVAVRWSPYQKFTVSDFERLDTFNKIASSYDSKTRMQEFYLGISYRRRGLVKTYGEGDVLEIGAGTGRNMSLFEDSKVKSVTMCDASTEMVEQMKQKAIAYKKPSDKYSFQVCSAEKLPFPDNSFDTVMDMFGLCSFQDPLVALSEMSRVCRPEGNIVLFEHGRGTAGWLNEYLDKYAPGHAMRWGCWWNRDIRRTVRLSGLVPDSYNQHHFGSTHVMVCKPCKK
eukprot:PhM_4_TR11959/c0_g1_i1/m.87301/K17803/OMS1; methyltransferase OMS1, mitochondrial